MNDMDELSVQYIKLRQQREVLAQQFKDADAVIEKDMAEIETQLLDTLNASNSNSMSTNTCHPTGPQSTSLSKSTMPTVCWRSAFTTET